MRTKQYRFGTIDGVWVPFPLQARLVEAYYTELSNNANFRQALHTLWLEMRDTIESCIPAELMIHPDILNFVHRWRLPSINKQGEIPLGIRAYTALCTSEISLSFTLIEAHLNGTPPKRISIPRWLKEMWEGFTIEAQLANLPRPSPVVPLEYKPHLHRTREE